MALPRRFNLWAATAMLGLLLAGAVGTQVARAVQRRRVRATALAEARAEAADKRVAEALRRLDHYLKVEPRDPEARQLQARLMAEAARTPEEALHAGKVNEQLLNLEPEGPEAQAARRRLVELYVRYSDVTRNSALSRTAPEFVIAELHYHAAEKHARALLARGADDASAHRALATALDGLAVPGDTAALTEAVAEYEAARRRDPKDPAVAERLARLCRERLKDPARAQRVLDDLVAAEPDSADVRLVRFRDFLRQRKDDLAAREIEQAARISPQDLAIRLTAASDALRRGDIVAARRHLAAVPFSKRDDLRVRVLRGLVDFGEEHPEDAIDGWRQCLMTIGGTDAELTWWLGYALLQLGRVAEARPLVARFRQLEGDDSQPLYRVLRALLDERLGRPARAIRDLEWAQSRISDPWQEKLQLALGRCYDSLNDPSRALGAYRRAEASESRSASAWLAAAAILARTDAGAASRELQRARQALPEAPELRLALAQARLREQLALPADRRTWGAFDAELKAAADAAPTLGAVVLLRAERLRASGRGPEALALLGTAARRDPKQTGIWVAWGEVLARSGRTDEALKVLADSAAAADRSAVRLARAGLLIRAGRGREAREALAADLSRMPVADRPLVLHALGDADRAQGRPDGARAAYAAWSKLLPEDVAPRLALLDLALDGEDRRAADATVAALRELGGEEDVAWRLCRAQQLLRDEAQPAALEEANRLVELVILDAPELAAARLLRGVCLERRGRPDEAIVEYKSAVEGGEPTALAKLADLLSRRGKTEELTRLAQAGSGGRADRVATLALWRAGDLDGAAKLAERAAVGRADTPEARLWQARTLDRLGKVAEAEHSFSEWARLRPTDLEPWLLLVSYQRERGRRAKIPATLAAARPALEADPTGLARARLLAAADDRDGADAAFELALKRRAGDADSTRAAAAYYDDTARPDLARDLLERALAADHRGREPARLLATHLAARADDPVAWRRAWSLVAAETAPPEPIEERLARAAVLSRAPEAARRFEAIPLFEAIVADLPTASTEAVVSRNQLARLLLEQGRFARAAEVAAVSAAAGLDGEAMLMQAEALMGIPAPDRAAATLDRLAALSPGDPAEARLRARLVRLRARPEAAAEALRRAYLDRAAAPGAGALGREVFAQLVRLKPPAPADAEAVARALADREPAAAWALATLEARRGRPTEALALCRAAVAVPNVSAADLVGAADAALTVATAPGAAEADRDGAAEVVEAALARRGSTAELLLRAAFLAHERGRLAEEVARYRELLAREPRTPVALNNLALALSEGLGRPAEALPMLDAALVLAGRQPYLLGSRGVVLLRLGRADEAAKNLEEAAARAPSMLRDYHLARAYNLQGRVEESRRARDRALAAGLSAAALDPTQRPELAKILAL